MAEVANEEHDDGAAKDPPPVPSSVYTVLAESSSGWCVDNGKLRAYSSTGKHAPRLTLCKSWKAFGGGPASSEPQRGVLYGNSAGLFVGHLLTNGGTESSLALSLGALGAGGANNGVFDVSSMVDCIAANNECPGPFLAGGTTTVPASPCA